MATKLTKDDVIQYSFRLNLNIENHLLIHQTLQKLNKQSRGAKSRFVIDSLVAGALKLNNKESQKEIDYEDQYVTHGELRRNNEKLVQEFSTDMMAKIISHMSILSGIQMTQIAPTTQQTNLKGQDNTKEILDETVEEMAQLYADWGND